MQLLVMQLHVLKGMLAMSFCSASCVDYIRIYAIHKAAIDVYNKYQKSAISLGCTQYKGECDGII